MFVNETDYWARKEYYADLWHQAQQARLIRNHRRDRSYWRSLVPRLLDTVLVTIPNTIGNRLIHWKEWAMKQQIHRFKNKEITSAL